MKSDEHEMIRRILDGQLHEYETLILRYESAVYNVLYQMLHQPAEAEELAQEVFVKAYEKLNTFNFESRFFSWIYRIAINTAISHRKKEQRYLHPEKMPENTEQMEDNPDQRMERDERDGLIRKAVAQLKEPYRAVVVLYYFEELAYVEIAEVLEVAEKTVKSRLFDARRMLRRLLMC